MYLNKKNLFLVISILLIFFFLTYKDVKSKEITPLNLLENFNICQTNSSLGQFCKDKNFNYLEYFKKGKIHIDNNTVHYEFDTWDYYFEIIKNTKNEVKFILEDNAKEASYLTKSEIILRYNKENLNWNLYSDETLYPESEKRKYFYLTGKATVIDGDTIKINDQNISEITRKSIDEAKDWFENLPKFLNERENKIAQHILKEINERLNFLLNVGLDYLTLSRESGTPQKKCRRSTVAFNGSGRRNWRNFCLLRC